ncbi:MAG: hypothetical protein Kow0069_37700 [Promethearchaeota archaeon]
MGIMDEETRQYYVRLFGFDPLRDKKPLRGWDDGFLYEVFFPLEKDPQLSALGIDVGARVVVESRGQRPHNRIVFRRGGAGGREESVLCVHTAVAQIPVGDLVGANDEDLLQMARSTEGVPVSLPPEEHFVALKSYVHGIAEMGVTNAFLATYHSPAVSANFLPFGFNYYMQTQIARCLSSLARDGELDAFLKHLLVSMKALLPPDWLRSRLELIQGIFFNSTLAWRRVFFGSLRLFRAFWRAMGENSEGYLLRAASWTRASPGVLAFLARVGSRRVALELLRRHRDDLPRLAWDRLFARNDPELLSALVNALPSSHLERRWRLAGNGGELKHALRVRGLYVRDAPESVVRLFVDSFVDDLEERIRHVPRADLVKLVEAARLHLQKRGRRLLKGLTVEVLEGLVWDALRVRRAVELHGNVPTKERLGKVTGIDDDRRLELVLGTLRKAGPGVGVAYRRVKPQGYVPAERS